MRFKLLPIFAALLLLCGCGGARTLADVSGCGQWSRVQIIEWYEQGGSAGTQLPADSLSPDTLRELLGSTYVRRSYASMELPVPCVQIFLTADDGALFTLAIGENGRGDPVRPFRQRSQIYLLEDRLLCAVPLPAVRSRNRILTIKKFRPPPDRQVFVKQLILRMA